MITPRGQNPTGAALDGERARELRAVLAEFPDALLIEDDHLGAVAGAPLHTLLRDASRRGTGPPRARSPRRSAPTCAWRVLAGDAHTIARVQRSPAVRTRLGQPHPADARAGAVARPGRRRASRARERDLRGSGASDCSRAWPPRAYAAHGASGLNVWIPVQDEAGTVSALMQRGWVLAPGAPYRLAGAAPGVRVTTATLSEQEAPRLAHDLAEVLAPSGFSRSG